VPNRSDLTTVASLIATLGSAMLFFRIDRELRMVEELSEIQWIPWADWLLLAATLVSLLAVLFPLVSTGEPSLTRARIATASCTGCIVLVAGYIFAILAHYRLILGFGRSGPRHNPEPGEQILVFLTILAAISVFAWVYVSLRPVFKKTKDS
jgi:hypothetical protein